MDPRAAAARYYDLNPNFPADVPFYLGRLPPGSPTVLELGCGTGRVSVPLAERAAFLHGIDHSEAMAEICRERLTTAGLLRDRAIASVADITSMRLDSKFDFIIAPFRVMQNLATDAEVDGLFATVRAHLAEDGRCILNAFHPRAAPEQLIEAMWSTGERLEWEVGLEGRRVTGSSRCTRIQAEPAVLFPDMIYRDYSGDRLTDETVLSIAMRCWYPEEFLDRVRAGGFEITGTWGGYRGEPFGGGPELVVEFTNPRR